MARESILVVEDDEDILELVIYNLQKEGFRATGVTSGEEAIKLARAKVPDLLLLDLMLPGVDGLQVCKTIKSDAKTGHIPIVMLTAKGEEADIVSGLELGADDYITKPFSPRVMIARVRSVLRRGSLGPVEDSATIKIGRLMIIPARFEVLVNGKPVRLTYTEFRILHFLARRPGLVFTRYQIVDSVHGDDASVTDRSIDVQIVGLRKKLGACGGYIETIRSIGYRFKDV
jgi:two-component system phosphate regulon response regulator PhoB